MTEDSRTWDNLRLELEVWLNESELRLSGKKVSECTVEELNKEIRAVEVIEKCITVLLNLLQTSRAKTTCAKMSVYL